MTENKLKKQGKQKSIDKHSERLIDPDTDRNIGANGTKGKQPFLDSTEKGKLGWGRDDSFAEEGSYPVNNPLPY